MIGWKSKVEGINRDTFYIIKNNFVLKACSLKILFLINSQLINNIFFH